ncbi:MAG: hypothetical protein U1E66_10075 [Rhodospirillales bacterium]
MKSTGSVSSVATRRAGLIAAVAVAVLLAPAIAAAACTKASGNGTWDVYATVVTGTPGWNRCSVTVTNGAVSGTCVTHTNASNTVTGTLNITSSCRVTGSLTHAFAGGPTYTATVVQATLGADDNVIMGVARSSSGLVESFQGLRR